MPTVINFFKNWQLTKPVTPTSHSNLAYWGTKGESISVPLLTWEPKCSKLSTRPHLEDILVTKLLQQSFYWPKLKQFTTTLISECPICQISKTEKVQYPGLLSPLPIPQIKWSNISLDFIEVLPKSRGKDVILVVVDRLTKYAHFLPLAHPYNVQKIADLFFDNIVKLHGPPEIIVSDRDWIFTSNLWSEIFSSLNISLKYSWLMVRRNEWTNV
jgi:hypothetical protein